MARSRLISGAARGIGAATARLMVEAGAKVAIGDVFDERGRETAGDRGVGDAAIYQHLDVTREEDWTAAIAATVARFGGLDILVNNAGMFLGKGIEEASLDEWHRLCAVNLTGVFLGTKLALPALRERGAAEPARQRDRQSGVGRRARRLAARPALFDDQGRGDVVHQIGGARIRPQGLSDTGQLDPSRGDPDRYGRADLLGPRAQSRQQRCRRGAPTAMSTAPDRPARRAHDIAKGIVFLASDDAGFMTGAGLVVDGGSTARSPQRRGHNGSASCTATPRIRPSAACTMAAIRSHCQGTGDLDRRRSCP